MWLVNLLIAYVVISIILILLRLWCRGGMNHAKRDLTGKTILITGGTNGMGRIVVEQLADTGAHIISCSRNNDFAAKVINEIKQQHKDCDIEHVHLDLNDLNSVKECAEEILSKFEKIDILINNAGLMNVPWSKTAQGFEKQMGVNYLGHALLTQKLLPLIEKVNGRVIDLSSVASTFYKRKEFPFTAEEKGFFSMRSYSESKLAMAIHAKQLAKRNDKITAVSLHPGCVNTGLWQYFPFIIRLGGIVVFRIVYKTPLEGCQTCLHLIHSENVENGEYYADCKVEKSRRNKTLDDEEACDKLWNDTMEVIKEYL